MPRLVHLNGPSGVGKSTLARRWADDHPGTLALDLDRLVGLVGGWRADVSSALEVARGLGRVMAEQHLRGGRDVVLPQLVTVWDQAADAAYEETAGRAGATYVQVALGADADEHLRRLRGRRPVDAVGEANQRSLVGPGSGLVDKIRGHLQDYLERRPEVLRLDTTGLDVEETYARLARLLGDR